MIMTKKEKSVLRKLKTAYTEANALGMVDLSNGGKVREYFIADFLDHRLSGEKTGPDAWTADGIPVEYKSTNITTGFTIRYNFQRMVDDFEEQKAIWKEYFNSRKLHYWVQIDRNYDIVQMYEVNNDVLYEAIFHRLESQWNTRSQRGLNAITLTLSIGYARRLGKQIV